MAKKQGYKDEEDESIGMRLGKKKTKHDKKVARDESYGKWGNRKKDWKAKSGTMVTAKGGTMIKAKKGFGKKLAKVAAGVGAAYLASKHLGKGYKNVHQTGAVSKTPGRWKNLKYAKDIHPGTSKAGPIMEKPGDLYSEVMGLSKKGGSVKAKAGKMVKARGGVIVNTKLNGPLFTETF